MTRSTVKLFLTLLLVLSSTAVFAQLPTYQAFLKNDVQVSSTVYEFDIYLLRTGGTTFEMSGCQVGLTFNDNIRNNGTLTATYITGTCEFSNSAQVPANPNVAALQGTTRVWKLASKAPPGFGAGSIISNVSPGTRVGRFRLTNSVNFGAASAAFDWTFSATQYVTKISAYDQTTGINTEITVQVNHLNELTNPVLPVELTAFSAVVNERNVVLNWKTASEINLRGFEVQRAKLEKDGIRPGAWDEVTFLKGSGNSNSPRNYTITDMKLNSGKYEYRLKMIDNDGTFKFSDPVKAVVDAPIVFDMSKNYPNPFNPSTKIEYQLPVNSKVMLELYSVTGEKIATLVDEDQETGYYIRYVHANSQRITSGVYIYRIVAVGVNGEKFVKADKMLMIK